MLAPEVRKKERIAINAQGVAKKKRLKCFWSSSFLQQHMSIWIHLLTLKHFTQLHIGTHKLLPTSNSTNYGEKLKKGMWLRCKSKLGLRDSVRKILHIPHLKKSIWSCCQCYHSWTRHTKKWSASSGAAFSEIFQVEWTCKQC